MSVPATFKVSTLPQPLKIFTHSSDEHLQKALRQLRFRSRAISNRVVSLERELRLMREAGIKTEEQLLALEATMKTRKEEKNETVPV